MFTRRKKNRQLARRSLQRPATRSLAFEQLESRDLLAIVWDNPGPTNDQDNFNQHYGTNAEVARAIVRRAINDWNAVIPSFNNGTPNDTFSLEVFAEELTDDRRDLIQFADMVYNSSGTPTASKIRLDNDGGGDPGPGWFFDETPTDDVEFTGLGNAFAASFIDVNGQATRREDFYRTVVHAIGHALGLVQDFNQYSAITSMLNPLFEDSSLSDPQEDPTGISAGSLY
jgi:hypothetical protein